MGRKRLNTQPFWRFAFLLYACTMLWLLFGRTWGYDPNTPYWEQVCRNYSLKAFYTIDNFTFVMLHRPNHPIFFEVCVNMIGNVLLFIPAGWLLPKLWRRFRPYWRFFLRCFCLIFLIELLQLFTLLGVFDVDDIILNMLGLTVGYFLYFLFHHR